jgi:hypothetical protein
MHEKINQQQGAFKTERSFGFVNPVSGQRPAASPRAAPSLPQANVFPSVSQQRGFFAQLRAAKFPQLLGM